MGINTIPVLIEFGTTKVDGLILKINPTGVLVELEKIPFRVGNTVKLSFTLAGIGSLSSEARPIKSYDNYKKKVRVETEDGPVIQERLLKLSELHFLHPSEEFRASIMKHLMDLQVSILKNTK